MGRRCFGLCLRPRRPCLLLIRLRLRLPLLPLPLPLPLLLFPPLLLLLLLLRFLRSFRLVLGRLVVVVFVFVCVFFFSFFVSWFFFYRFLATSGLFGLVLGRLGRYFGWSWDGLGGL